MLPALRIAEIAKRTILLIMMDLMIWAGLR
jgi:hypothetical protein